MFDPTRTISLVKGAILDSEATWRAYLPEAGDWKKTAVLLTGPLIVVSVVLGYLVALVFAGDSIFVRARPTLPMSLMNIIVGFVAIGVIAWILSTLSGVFGGKSSFALGLAAATLAFVPGYVGQIVTWLPWIGGLLAIGLAIYSLVLLWRIIPIYLEVPGSKRVLHYVISLIAAIIVMAIVGNILARIMPGPDIGGFADRYSDSLGSDRPSLGAGGVVGAAMRQAELLEAAESDTYSPPSDGELTEKQVQEYIRVMQRAAELQSVKEERLKEIAENAEKNNNVSFSDISDMMGSVTSLAGPAGGEMEVVKSADGNWAEHVWVRDSLRTAFVQRDINDAVAHNYELYQKYEEDLAPFIAK